MRENLIGKKYGTLTVIGTAPDYIEPKTGTPRPRWKCLCDCGKETIINGRNLKRAKSCGCLTNKLISQANKKHNIYDLSGDFGKGYDSAGNEFWFDLEDYDKIKGYYWAKLNNGYYIATTKQKGKVRTLQLHRLILDIENEDYHLVVGDHIHGKNTLHDNRKSNLRIATRSQNAINSAKRRNSSGVTGVVWNKSKRKWIAIINDTPGHHLELGAFDRKDDAIRARKEGEIKYYGEFSYDYSRRSC